jgi:hypothetical protein
MAADGGERIRTFCSLNNREILEGTIPTCFLYCLYMCESRIRCLYLLKNANEKNQHEQV